MRGYRVHNVAGRDYPVVFALLFIYILIGLVSSFLTDIMYCIIDPRINQVSARIPAPLSVNALRFDLFAVRPAYGSTVNFPLS